MPTFDTPSPISVDADLIAGDIRLIASERADTTVVVTPRSEASDFDVRAAAEARIEFRAGKLIVKLPKSLQTYFTRRGGTVDVTVELPTGSHVRGYTAMGDVHGEGPMGDCTLKTSMGDIVLDSTGSANLSTMHGQITVAKIAGDGHIVGSGEVRIRAIDGKASIKNLNGHSWVGEAVGDISLNSAHGNMSVDRVHADAVARTAHGSVRLGEVRRGSVVLDTASGDLEVGVARGTAAWLELKTSWGRVRNDLDSTDRPEAQDERVEIRARTHDGDIVIRRATK